MKISKRGEYALRALIDIGIAQELGRPLVQIGDLAEKENLPIKFLEQILMQLKEGGFIESKRGKLGGYYLLMPARQIRFGQVIRLVDGPLAPIACVSHTAYERCSCPDEEHCGLRMLMNDVRNAIANILDRFTLEDTVEMTLRKIRRNKPSIPFIDGLLSRPVMEDPLLPNLTTESLSSKSSKKVASKRTLASKPPRPSRQLAKEEPSPKPAASRKKAPRSSTKGGTSSLAGIDLPPLARKRKEAATS